MSDKQTASSDQIAWHNSSSQQVLEMLQSVPTGLSSAEAGRRLGQYGANQLKPSKPASPIIRFLLQFHNVLIYILLAASVITAFLGHWVDSGVILGVVVINAMIGFIQEGKAEKALNAIRHMLSLTATVLRETQ
jgi:magnesium-transporting ATPase (P-type)